MGALVGARVGSTLGNLVGANEGARVGARVGASEGARVGGAVGPMVVGAAVGENVGCLVGACVGACDAMQPLGVYGLPMKPGGQSPHVTVPAWLLHSTSQLQLPRLLAHWSTAKQPGFVRAANRSLEPA